MFFIAAFAYYSFTTAAAVAAATPGRIRRRLTAAEIAYLRRVGQPIPLTQPQREALPEIARFIRTVSAENLADVVLHGAVTGLERFVAVLDAEYAELALQLAEIKQGILEEVRQRQAEAEAVLLMLLLHSEDL